MTQLSFDFSPSRVPFADEQCQTCGGELIQRRPPANPTPFCSYWCRLVVAGPDFYTLETITPWLRQNRNYKR